MNSKAVNDWLHIRRELLDKESEFTDLAIKVARGEGSEEHLRQERQILESMRVACREAYERAFPPPK